MTPATPKPRAGEHTPTSAELVASVLSLISEDIRVAAALDIEAALNLRLLAERDLLRERERELVEELDQCSDMLEDAYITNEDAAKAYGITAAVKRARTLLAKHGR